MMFGCKKLDGIIAYQTVEVYRQTDRQANEEQPEKNQLLRGIQGYMYET